MSVDTYMKGKNTAGYHVTEVDGVKVYVAPSFAGFARSINLRLNKLLFLKSFQIEVESRTGEREHVHTGH